MSQPTLLAVPNVSEGRRGRLIDELGQRLCSAGSRLLDVHSDPDHNRSVLTVAGDPGKLAGAVLSAARLAIEEIDMRGYNGAHPAVGAIDVAPIVYLHEGDVGAACAEALVLADLLADQLALPVFMYGALADGRSRSDLRRGGPAALAQRVAAGELTPDFGPRRPHPTAGVTLVSARPPLVAFNVELAPPANLEDAKAIAIAIREGGSQGLESVRAIGVWLAASGVAQVSTNVEDPGATSLAEVVAAVAKRTEVLRAELVGLAPAHALERFPQEVELRGRATIEEALAQSGSRESQSPG